MSEERHIRPAPKKDYIDVQIHKEDLSILCELLDNTIAFYTIASNSAIDPANADANSELKSRIRLLNAFNSRFKASLLIGEPESRDEH